MEPKALKRLMQLPRQKRAARIAEGLELLAAQVATLEADLSLLAEAERWRGLDILSAEADEEAAKALILLDFVRMHPGDEEALARQLGRFYEHLARCIYVEMAEMSPADFAEVKRLVDSMRASHYLDGPNDVDWLFRNQLLARREESLYVDFVHEEEGDRWVPPAANDLFLYPPATARVRKLVGAFHRLGVMSVEGLALVADHWSSMTLQEETHWQEVLPINRAIIEEGRRLRDQPLAVPDGQPGPQQREGRRLGARSPEG
jgi:hypothetical protein